MRINWFKINFGGIFSISKQILNSQSSRISIGMVKNYLKQGTYCDDCSEFFQICERNFCSICKENICICNSENIHIWISNWICKNINIQQIFFIEKLVIYKRYLRKCINEN